MRIQSMNGVNLNLFQFECDLTWMAFFMDGSDHVYARYGGREDESPESHLNRESLIKVMRQVLGLHRSREVQGAKYEPGPVPATTPEDIPTMAAHMAPRKEKCIHCHDVKVARLRHMQKVGTFTLDALFTYPAPSRTGIRLNPRTQNEVLSVEPGSSADRAGIRAGDAISAADGQRILSFADFSRVLECLPAETTLPLSVMRGDQRVRATLRLSGAWKRNADPSWRECLHVAGPGSGFWGVRLTGAEKRGLGVAENEMAIRVTAVFGNHAREAGVRNGDVVVALDQMKKDLTIQQLQAHLHLNRNSGDSIPVIVRRGSEMLTLTLRLPEGQTH